MTTIPANIRQGPEAFTFSEVIYYNPVALV